MAEAILLRGQREICNLGTQAGRREYKRRTMEMRERQNEICPSCGLYLDEADATFDHHPPRGHGGANRDDRIWIEVDGVRQPKNFSTHSICNGARGSKRNLVH